MATDNRWIFVELAGDVGLRQALKAQLQDRGMGGVGKRLERPSYAAAGVVFELGLEWLDRLAVQGPCLFVMKFKPSAFGRPVVLGPPQVENQV